MLRKGQIQNLSSMVLIILAGGIVAGTIGGPLYGAMEEGYNEIQQFLGLADRVEIEDTDELAAFAHYTWDRAISCDQVDRTIEDGGYTPLEGTAYAEAPCSSQKGTPIANYWNVLGGTGGGDMEGSHSRLRFEIKERIVLDTSEQYGVHEEEGWEGASYNEPYDCGPATGCRYREKSGRFQPWAVSVEGEPFKEVIAEECDTGWFGFAASTTSWPVVFNVPESKIDEDSRLNFYDSYTWSEAEEDVENKEGLFETLSSWTRRYPNNKPFCSSGATEGAGYLAHSEMERFWNGETGRTEIALCPGDKGYLQVNKGEPQNEDEWTKDGGNLFPYIEITELGEGSDCSVSRPQIPKDANSVGSDLVYKGDLAEGWDSELSKKVRNFRLEKQSRSVCRFSINEEDPGPNEKGYVDYKPGTVLQADDMFPGRNSGDVIDKDLPTGGWGEDGALKIYKYFSQEYGMNDDENINPTDAPILDAVGVKKLEFYGDLLCADSFDGASNPQWVACDESVEGLEDGDTVTVNPDMASGGTTETYKCDLAEGEWYQPKVSSVPESDGDDSGGDS